MMNFVLFSIPVLILLRVILSSALKKSSHIDKVQLFINVAIIFALTVFLFVEGSLIFVKSDNSAYLLLIVILIIYGTVIYQSINNYKRWKNKGTN